MMTPVLPSSASGAEIASSYGTRVVGQPRDDAGVGALEGGPRADVHHEQTQPDDRAEQQDRRDEELGGRRPRVRGVARARRSRSSAISGASPSTAGGTVSPSWRRHERNAVAVIEQPAGAEQPAGEDVGGEVDTERDPGQPDDRDQRDADPHHEPPTPGRTTGSRTSSTTPTHTVTARVWPLGNEGPPAAATGMSTIGRSRSTSCLSRGLSMAVPSPVTAT